MVSLFALLPSPFVYGAIIDHSCVLWDSASSCEGDSQSNGSQSLNCLVYNTDKMRYLLNGVTAVAIFLAALCDTAVYYYAKNLNLYDNKDQKQVIHSNEKETIL